MALVAAHLKTGVIPVGSVVLGIVSLFPHLRTPFPTFSRSLISLVVSVDIKHHVWLLTYDEYTHSRFSLSFSSRLIKTDVLTPRRHDSVSPAVCTSDVIDRQQGGHR